MIISFLRFIGHQDWVLPGIRKRLIWNVLRVLNIRDFDFEAGFFGLKYKGNTSNYIERFIFYFGAYEKGLLRFISDNLGTTKEKVFIDIGANIGHHSIFASLYAKEVHSFEPYHVVRNKFQETIRLNGIANITIQPFGLGQVESSIPFYEPPNSNLGSGSFVSHFSHENVHKGLSLEIKRGDAILLDFRRIDIIKIDVEGFETSVLQGLKETIKKFKPIIIMEYTSDTKVQLQAEQEIIKLLSELYHVKRFRNPNDLPYKLSQGDFEHAGFVDLVFIPK